MPKAQKRKQLLTPIKKAKKAGRNHAQQGGERDPETGSPLIILTDAWNEKWPTQEERTAYIEGFKDTSKKYAPGELEHRREKSKERVKKCIQNRAKQGSKVTRPSLRVAIPEQEPAAILPLFGVTLSRSPSPSPRGNFGARSNVPTPMPRQSQFPAELAYEPAEDLENIFDPPSSPHLPSSPR